MEFASTLWNKLPADIKPLIEVGLLIVLLLLAFVWAIGDDKKWRQ